MALRRLGLDAFCHRCGFGSAIDALHQPKPSPYREEQRPGKFLVEMFATNRGLQYHVDNCLGVVCQCAPAIPRGAWLGVAHPFWGSPPSPRLLSVHGVSTTTYTIRKS